MEINQTEVIRARILLAYLEAYRPKEHALFIAALGDILQSFEDERFVEAVLRYAEGFLLAHPEDQERLQSVSPREMVEEVGQQLVEDAKKRRGDIRLRAREIVNKYVHGTTTEKQELEDKLVTSINASINKAETPQQLRAAIEEEVATMPLPTKEVVQQLVDADPLSAQHLLLTNPARDSVIVGHITGLPAPAWRGYIAAVENLQMGPNETFEEHAKRAKEVGQTAAFLSADFSQTPAAHAEPGRLVSAILEATGNKTAIKAFEGLAEQTKNIVSLMVVAKAWEDAVDIVTKRAGGALAKTLEPIIQKMNKQPPPGGAIKQAASLVSGVIDPLLGRTLERLAELETLNLVSPDKIKALVSSPQTLLLLAVYEQWPGGTTFEQRSVGGSLGPVAWTVHWTTNSVVGEIFNRTAKSEGVRGFFSKFLGLFGFRVGTQAAVGAAGGVAGKAATGGLIKIFGSLVGALSGPWGWAISIAGGIFGAPLFNKAKEWLGNLLSGRIGKLKTAQDAIIDAFGGRAGGRSAQEEQKKTDFYIALLVGVPIIVLITATMFQITVRDSALIGGFYDEPDRFIEDPVVYPPPDYLDVEALKSKSFPCLSYGAGVSTQHGASRALTGSEKTIVENTIDNNPAIKALSCALSCPSKNVSVSAFSEEGAYVGYAPSALAGNIIFYPRMFSGFSEQSRARLLAHELAHNIDWFGGGLAEGYYPLRCGPTGKYPWKETPEEEFATAVELYVVGNPFIRDFCGGRAYEYFGKTIAQCR